MQQTTHTSLHMPRFPSPQSLSSTYIVGVLLRARDSWRDEGGGSLVILVTVVYARDLLCNFPGGPAWQQPLHSSIQFDCLTVFTDGSLGAVGCFYGCSEEEAIFAHLKCRVRDGGVGIRTFE